MNYENKKFEEIFENSINGNLTDYHNSIRKLTKIELLDYIEYCNGQGYHRHNSINDFRIILNNK